MAFRDGKPVVMTPDLICVLDSVSGEAIGTETVRYGQRVTVVALPAPAVLIIRVAHAGVANALGAAMDQVSGEADQIFSDVPRDAAPAEARAIAERRAREAGADPATLTLVEIEDIPIAYLPGGARRVRARVVGDVQERAVAQPG